MPINDGGPAFPLSDGNWNKSGGMSLRDYFAAQVLPSALSASASGDGCYDYVAAAAGAYAIADAMLLERVKE